MYTGTIKNWDKIKGWGFIEDDKGYDYFVHIQNVRKGQHLKIGDQVKFDIFEDQRGQAAENVMKIK